MKSLLLTLLFLSFHSLHAGLVPIDEVFSPSDLNYPPSKYFKVAVLQWANPIDTPVDVSTAKAEQYKATNRGIIADYIEQASQNGAKLFVTP